MAAIMRKTRASYHYAVRQIKRRERELRKRKMAESVSTNKQRDIIWVETKKMLSGKKPSINSVDRACNSEAISEVFASKFESLFQGTPTLECLINVPVRVFISRKMPPYTGLIWHYTFIKKKKKIFFFFFNI